MKNTFIPFFGNHLIYYAFFHGVRRYTFINVNYLCAWLDIIHKSVVRSLNRFHWTKVDRKTKLLDFF